MGMSHIYNQQHLPASTNHYHLRGAPAFNMTLSSPVTAKALTTPSHHCSLHRIVAPSHPISSLLLLCSGSCGDLRGVKKCGWKNKKPMTRIGDRDGTEWQRDLELNKSNLTSKTSS